MVRPVDKGPATRMAIIDAGIRQASRGGLGGITFAGLAAELRMSKSGVSAHFTSKEVLQLATLFDRYLDWMEQDCCLDTVVAQELDVLPDAVAAAFRDRQGQWRRAVVAAVGQVVEAERVEEVALQFLGLALAHQQHVAVFGDTGSRPQIEAILERATTGASC